MQNRLTVILLTFNEEQNLPECFESIKTLNANLFVVDSFSTDGTVEFLKKNQINYVQHPFENYANQRNWAQQHNPFNTEWVFHLDAGERFTEELTDWLKNKFDPENNLADGYMFSRRTMIFGKEVYHGGQYPNFHLRLFRAVKGKCEEKLYDQHFVVAGNVKAIKHRIDIIDTVLDSWHNFIEAHNRWALYEAIEIVKQNQADTGEVKSRLFGSPIERRRWFKNNIFQKAPLFIRSLLFFLYRYIFRFGFLDGKTGLAFHFLQGFWFRFLIDANVLEIRVKLPTYHNSLKELVFHEYGEKFVRLVE
ncbi:MAG TPA: glycosyltransferase family 2 protein [Bacteroidales bacterium]